MHSEEAVGLRTTAHQQRNLPYPHTDEECVALFRDTPVPEGEAFPIVAPGSQSLLLMG
jgi:hypothetical protein